MDSSIKEQCMEYIFKNFSITLNSLNYLVEGENNNSVCIFQPEKLISEYIVNEKEKNDYMLIQRMLNNGQKNISVYTNDFEYRVNDTNWDYHELNKHHKGLNILTDLYKEHSHNVTDEINRTELYLNYKFEEVFSRITVDHTKKSKPNNGSFNSKILDIRISQLKKHFSRNDIVVFNQNNGSISLRFMSRNKDKLCYFDEETNINGLYIKDLMHPLNILCAELGASKYSILEVLMPFDIKDGLIEVNQPKLNISSISAPLLSSSSGAPLSLDTVYDSIEFRKFFEVLGMKKDNTFLKTEKELYSLIENYKLLVY